jgi:hypothetical protein
MGLGKQERRGIVILVFVTLAITSLGFVMRYCGRPGDAAPQVPVQTVIYRPAADDAAEESRKEPGPRHKKKCARKKTARKKTGKGTESKAGASQGPRRDFLRDTIPVPRDYR